MLVEGEVGVGVEIVLRESEIAWMEYQNIRLHCQQESLSR